MTRRLLVAAALVVAFGAFFLSDPPPAAPRVRTIGLIEHRGQFYRLEDLMNPKIRGASNDPFVQSFGQPSQIAADSWAGLEIVDKSKRDPLIRKFQEKIEQSRESMMSDAQKQMLQEHAIIPWAGTNEPAERD